MKERIMYDFPISLRIFNTYRYKKNKQIDSETPASSYLIRIQKIMNYISYIDDKCPTS